MTLRLVSVVAIVGVLSVGAAHAQAPASDGWSDRTAAASSLAVMINTGGRTRCHGTGFIVGADQRSVYVVTAAHVIKPRRDAAPLPTLGVRFRFRRDNETGFPFEKVAVARIVNHLWDDTSDLAALAVDDVEIVKALERVSLTLAGDSTHLVPGDKLYSVGCGGSALLWDTPTELASVLPTGAVPGRPIAFTRNYVREGFSGGPVIHLFNTVGTVVGMTLNYEGVGLAASLDHVLRKAREWGVPVTLTAPGTSAGCTYTVSPTKVTLTGERREAAISVQTGDRCPWAIVSQVDPVLIEREGYWFEASGPDGAGEGPRRYSGSGRALMSAGVASPCNGVRQRAVARVAGTMIQVEYDGRCTGPAPPSRVSRNPAYANRTPGGLAAVSRPAPAAAPSLTVATDATSVAAAREALQSIDKDEAYGPRNWGCNLYGCRFYEPRTAGFCHPAVARVELGETAASFPLTLDRAACANYGNQRELCYDAPHLPFSVAPGKTLYARVHFGDGSVLIKPLPVSTSVLRRALIGKEFSGLEGIENWTRLEPVGPPGKTPAPYAALVYAAGPTGGSYAMFVGLRGCGSRASEVRGRNWLFGVDGAPPVSKADYELRLPVFANTPTGTGAGTRMTRIIIAADTQSQEHLGPFIYQVDINAPVTQAAKRPPLVALACAKNSAGQTVCRPNASKTWSTALALRLGPTAVDWREELVFANGTLPPTQRPITSSRRSTREFSFTVPTDWPRLFYQLVLEDGRLATIDWLPEEPGSRRTP